MSEALKYKLALTLIPGVGDVLAKTLVSYCRGAEAVFSQKKEHLLKIPGIGSVIADAIVKHNVFERAEQEMKFIEQQKIQALFYLDKNYPERLRQCSDAPIVLYFKGNVNLNNTKVLSVVGTRNATEYGKEMCERIIAGLKDENPLIVSGLAYGVDIAAHKAALKHSLQTVAVLAHGLDRIYPALHRSTALQMIEMGGWLTDFPSGTNPDRENFPKRNRIIAGLADAVIVIEAAHKGGALITAEIANTYNRDVFAVPGRAGDTFSEGCNFLIKTNRAALLESAADLKYFLGWEETNAKKTVVQQQQLFVDLNPDEKMLFEMLKNQGPMPIDTINLHSNLPVSKVAAGLLSLEFSGIVKSLPGKVYQLA